MVLFVQLEVPELKKVLGEDFITVTPGIRIQQKKDDQSRVAIFRKRQQKMEVIILF